MRDTRGLGQAARRGRLRALDALTLAAVALVVLLVSLPRLADMAVRENEADARWLMGRLAELGREQEAPVANIQELLQAEPGLQRLLDDVEYLEGGRLLRRHGYLFELLPAGSDSGADAACRLAGARAWPWQYERTGRAAFLWSCGLALRSHPNRQARWSGTDHRPARDAHDSGWSELGP